MALNPHKGGSDLIVSPSDQPEVPENVFLTTMDSVVSWCRKHSLWPMPFATACCGIELMAVGASRCRDSHRMARSRTSLVVRGIQPVREQPFLGFCLRIGSDLRWRRGRDSHYPRLTKPLISRILSVE